MKIRILRWLLLKLLKVGRVRSDEERRIFHKLWTEVWVQEEYAHEDEPLHKIEFHYALFESHSIDLLLWFLGVIPIGTLRIIKQSSFGLPTTNDLEVEEHWQKDIEERQGVVEFTLLTLKERWRGLKHAPSFILMLYAYRLVREQVGGVVIAADERLFRLFQKIKMPFVQIGPTQFYEGSPTVPAFLPVPEAEDDFRKANPPLAEFFLS